MRNLLKNQNGVFLIGSYLVLTLLGALSFAVYSRHFAAIHAHERAQNQIQAFHLAESGVDRAFYEITNDLTSFVLCLPPSPLNPGATCWQQGYSALGNGGYDVNVTWHSLLIRKIQATGYIPNNDPNSVGFSKRTVEAYVNLGAQIPVNFGTFGCEDMKLSGNAKVDSYNSAVAPYNPLAAGLNGDLGTNATGAGKVKLSGNANVKGDIFVGPGGDPLTVVEVSGNATQVGLRLAATSLTACSDVQVPGSVTNGGDLHLSGNTTQTLAGGTYVYDSLKVTGNAKLEFTSAATVYVQGNVNFEGNSRVTSTGNLPKNLIIKVAGERDVELEGNANFHGVIHAPRSEVEAEGNAKIYGSLFGESYEQEGNAELHYDEDLANTSLQDVAGFGMVAWQEQ